MRINFAYTKPIAWGTAALIPIMVLSVSFNSAVVSFRLRELDNDLTAAARTQKENRNLAMFVQYDLLKNRFHKPMEDALDYRMEAELLTFTVRDEAPGQVNWKHFMDPAAAVAIRGIRYLMGKKTEVAEVRTGESIDLQDAYMYERHRQYEKAITLYGSMLKGKKTRQLKPEVLLHMGFCNSLLGKFNLARLLFREVIETYGGSEEAGIAARLYLKLEVLELARRNESQALLEAGDPLVRARSLFRSLRYEDAIILFKEVLSDNRHRAHEEETRFLTGRCL
jgi:tetratricopeptide (TPR) repeat protein